MKITILHRVIITVVVIMFSSVFYGFLCSKSEVEETTGQLEEQIPTSTPETLTVLTQKGGSVVVDGGSCSETGVADAQIENEYLGSSYLGGELHTFSCDTDDQINSVKAIGRLGGQVCKPEKLFGVLEVPNLSFDWNLTAKEGVIGTETFGIDLTDIIGGIAPEVITSDIECIGQSLGYKLPAPCPLLESFRAANGLATSFVDQSSEDRLDVCQDPNNNPPPEVEGLVTFDGDDVLMIESIDTTCDFESMNIIMGYLDGDVSKPVSEGYLGGVYSNLRYAVMPFDPAHETLIDTLKAALPTDPSPYDYNQPCVVAGEVSKLMKCAFSTCSTEDQAAYDAWQDLLALAIDGTGMDRAEGQIPFNYWNKEVNGGPQCEIFDSVNFAASQDETIAEQTASYGQTFEIWDWTEMVNAGVSPLCVTVLIWEGDGNSTTEGRAHNLIGPNDYADDLVAVLKVCRDDTDGSSETYTNFTGDVNITLTTGQLQCP